MSLKESESSTAPDDYYKKMEADAESAYRFLGNFVLLGKNSRKLNVVVCDANIWFCKL